MSQKKRPGIAAFLMALGRHTKRHLPKQEPQALFTRVHHRLGYCFNGPLFLFGSHTAIRLPRKKSHQPNSIPRLPKTK